MPRVGIRELQDRTSRIIQDVYENRTRYVILHDGRPVAVLIPVPVEEEPSGTEVLPTGEQAVSGSDGWADMEALREEIGRSWQSEKTAVELIAEPKR